MRGSDYGYWRYSMSNTVRDWMSEPVVVVDPDSSVSFALTLMRRRNVHGLVVDIAEDRLTYGIITTTISVTKSSR